MINIGKGIMLFAALTIAGLLAIVGATTTALNQLRIGSESYRIIVDAKDLTADILPPPMYVIEAYLEAKLAAEQPSSIAQRRTKLSELENDFRTRRDVWAKSALPGNLRDALTIRSANHADQFWQELKQRLLPAIESSNAAQVARSMQALDQSYTEHRKAIDDVVTMATQFQTNAEAAADVKNGNWTMVLYTTAGIVLAVVLAGTMAIRMRAVSPIRAMTDYMRALTEGRYDPVPFSTRHDEIGEMAQSVAIFRQSLLDRQAASEREEMQRLDAERQRGLQEAERNATDEERRAVVAGLARGLENLAQGDLGYRIDQVFTGAYDQLRRDFNAAMDALQTSMGLSSR